MVLLLRNWGPSWPDLVHRPSCETLSSEGPRIVDNVQ